jgi:hypothetical protein
MMNGTEGVGDREDLIGRATGAMVMALFGLLWALGCAGVLVAGALGPILLASSASSPRSWSPPACASGAPPKGLCPAKPARPDAPPSPRMPT